MTQSTCGKSLRSAWYDDVFAGATYQESVELAIGRDRDRVESFVAKIAHSSVDLKRNGASIKKEAEDLTSAAILRVDDASLEVEISDTCYSLYLPYVPMKDKVLGIRRPFEGETVDFEVFLKRIAQAIKTYKPEIADRVDQVLDDFLKLIKKQCVPAAPGAWPRS